MASRRRESEAPRPGYQVPPNDPRGPDPAHRPGQPGSEDEDRARGGVPSHVPSHAPQSGPSGGDRRPRSS